MVTFKDGYILDFNDAEHVYTLYGPSDEITILPSVTALTKPFQKYDDIDELTLEAAADRGVTVHRLTEAVDALEPEIECPAVYEGYVEAYRAYLSDHSVVHVHRETPVCHVGLGYAGTPDAVSYVDDALAIVDYKCTSTVNKAAVSAQVNAYQTAFEDMHGIPVEARYCLHLRGDGTYKLYPVSRRAVEFEACLFIHKSAARKHPRGGIE